MGLNATLAVNLALLCALAASLAFAQQPVPPADQFATIEGTVINATTGEPLRKAHVTLELAEEPSDSALVATTGDAGQFRFADVKPGRYRLTADKGGFVAGSYGQDTPDDREILLKVSGNEKLPHITLKLFPGGVISGHVLDPEGDLLPGATVVLSSTSHIFGRTLQSFDAQTNTDQDGAYRFEGLSPGTYYVRVLPEGWRPPREVPVDSSGKVTRIRNLTTYYPAATSPADAQAIRVESGQERTDIDVSVQRGPMLRIKGRITGAPSAVLHYELGAVLDDGTESPGGFAKVFRDGEFVLEDLMPGKYRLSLSERDSATIIGKTEVTLTDQDVTDVLITPFTPAQVRARVVIEGEEEKPLTNGSVSLLPEDPSIP